MRYNVFALLIIVTLVFVAMGCASPAPQPPQDAMDAANATADRMFPELNNAEYIVFSQNFSAPMKAAMNESRYNQEMGKISGQYGRYVSRSSAPSAAVVGDYNVFVYQCKFEKGGLNLQLTMNKTDVWKVEGFYYR